MASPYTSPTLTGYNSSPPADDGSAVASNAVTWAKHIDKIGDPIKLFAQTMDTNIAAAFGKMFGNNVTTLASNTNIDGTYQGKLVVTSAAVTLSLLAAATASTNFTVAVYNGASTNADCTIDPNSTETVNGASTLVLRPGEWAILVCDGSNWRAMTYQKPVTPATQATTSGNAVDFTGIPSWVTHIAVSIVGVSTNGSTDRLRIQIGDAGGIENTGYSGSVNNEGDTSSSQYSGGFDVSASNAAANVWHGVAHLYRHGTDGLTWVFDSHAALSNSTNQHHGSGSKALSAQLDRLRFTLSGTPTDAFDEGSVGVWYS